MTPRSRIRHLRSGLLLAAGTAVCSVAPAQISLTTAVDLALRNSPRVQVAQADVARTEAILEESRDVYIPSLTGGSGLGYSYGFPLGQPTLFNFQAQSLVFSASQKDYIRAARSGLQAANLALGEVRAAIAEDAVNTYIALAHDQSRLAALHEQQAAADRLVGIVQDRLAVGEDTPIGLTSSRLTAAQIRLNLLRTEDDSAVYQDHLSHLTGLPAYGLEVSSSSLPSFTPPSTTRYIGALPLSPGVRAAFANAHAKREQAFGDTRYLWRPQVVLAAQYSRFSTFNNYEEYYPRIDPATGQRIPFQLNAIGVGIQISLPILDYSHRAKARESDADARHAEHDAEEQRNQFLEGRVRTTRTQTELAAREEVAELDQQLAAQQLDIMRVQLEHGGATATPMTPKDEQNARITERDKYLTFLDAQFELQQTSVSLLRQNGELEAWLKTLDRSASPASHGGGSPAASSVLTSEPPLKSPSPGAAVAP